MQIDNEHLFGDILKDELSEYLNITNTNKLKKVDLQNKILELIKDEVEEKKFLKRFERETAIYPSQLEEILQCTKTERLRWSKEGKLKIVDKIPFKYGEFPIFSRYQIRFCITEELINQWREEYNLQKSQKDKTLQIKKSNETKNKRNSLRKEIIFKLNEQKIVWVMKDRVLCASFDLAYWTTWLSRLAKTYQEKSYTAYRKKAQYEEKKKECYKLKKQAMFALFRSPYAKVSFYQPEQPHKYDFCLCNNHMDEFRTERSYYMCSNVLDFFFRNEEEILACEQCTCTVERDYYSLYYLELADNDYGTFSFHLPYSLGKDFFGSYTKFPMVKHEEQEGAFRFGRPLLDFEECIFTYSFVLKQFNQAFEAFNKIVK